MKHSLPVICAYETRSAVDFVDIYYEKDPKSCVQMRAGEREIVGKRGVINMLWN